MVLKLLFGKHLPVEANIQQVKRSKEAQEKELSSLNTIRKQLSANQADSAQWPCLLLSVKYGEYVNRAYIRWAEQAVKTLQTLKEEASG